MPITVSHVKSNTVADWTGTVTVGNSAGGTATVAATALVRPSDWNSVHAHTFAVSATEISGLFSNANGISFGLSDSSITASHNALTTAMASNRGSDFVQATAGFFGTSASGTIASDGISVSIGPYITTAALSNHSHGNPTLALTNLSGTTDSNSAGLTLSLSAAAPGGGAVNFSAGTTSGNLGSVVFSNSNGVSFGLDGSTITASHNALTTARASTDAVGLNTAQTNVTWTVNSSGISLNAGGYAGTGTSATNATVTLDSNGLQISVAPPGGGAGNTISEWCPYPEMNLLTASSLVNGSLYFNPVDVPEALNAYRANFFLSVATTISASNNTKSGSWRLSFCLYSRGTGASTDRLESLLSRSAYISFTASSHTRIQIDHPAGIANSTSVSQSSTSGAATNTSTYVVSSVGGFRVLPLPISSTLTPGRYWMAVGASFVSANAQGIINCSVVQQTHGSNIAYMPFGTASKASNVSWPHVIVGRGVYSATSGGFPATVALSTDDIRQLATTVVLPFFNLSGYTTATNQP